jgi:copper chaperone CopZ
MAPDAIVAHRTAGRLRLRVPSKKGDALYFASVRDALSAIEGVESVEVSPVTGSVLVRHTAPFAAIKAAGPRDLFNIVETAQTETTALHDSVSTIFGSIDDRIKGITGRGVDLAGLAFLALVAAGVYQIARGNFTAPAWYTAFWYALGLFKFGKSSKSGGETEKDPA